MQLTRIVTRKYWRGIFSMYHFQIIIPPLRQTFEQNLFISNSFLILSFLDKSSFNIKLNPIDLNIFPFIFDLHDMSHYKMVSSVVYLIITFINYFFTITDISSSIKQFENISLSS